ncbi:hypothetical protein LZK76_19015 [Rhizobium leguminosarum]|nr:hypothetical protein LZK76_19015 [Rhizobium leguminosarum]
MGRITKAGAWCNGEVAYLAWMADGPIADCLGFMITRVHETGPEAGARRILPTWIAFTDQSNPDWLEQDSSVWPIQQYQWRDLTLRRSRDEATVRPIDFRIHYEITPVGLAGPGRKPVPASDTAPYRDENGKPRYVGPPRPLFFWMNPSRPRASTSPMISRAAVPSRRPIPTASFRRRTCCASWKRSRASSRRILPPARRCALPKAC